MPLSNSRKRVALAYHLSSSLGLTKQTGNGLVRRAESRRRRLSLNLVSYPNAITVGILIWVPVVWPTERTATWVFSTMYHSECQLPKWTNEWMSATPSVTDSQQALQGKCHTPLCVVAYRTPTRPLCHSLGFGCLLGAGDQMQPFHNWLRSWVVLLGNGADERMNTSAVYFLQTGDTIKVTPKVPNIC